MWSPLRHPCAARSCAANVRCAEAEIGAVFVWCMAQVGDEDGSTRLLSPEILRRMHCRMLLQPYINTCQSIGYTVIMFACTPAVYVRSVLPKLARSLSY